MPNIRFGCPITDLDLLDHDVIVGADGIGSIVCDALVERPCAPVDLGVNVLIGQFPGATDTFTEYWGPGSSFGVTPLSTDRCDWQVAYRTSAEAAAQDSHRFVIELYRGWDPSVEAALRETYPDSLIHYRIRTMPRFRRIYRAAIPC